MELMRAEEEDFKTDKLINAPVADVFNTLSNLDGLPAHWKSIGKETGLARRIVLERGKGVKSTVRINICLPQLTQWTVVSDTGPNSDWENTIIRFELQDMGDETCTLHFMHIGLTPELENYSSYINYWQHFISSIVTESEPVLSAK